MSQVSGGAVLLIVGLCSQPGRSNEAYRSYMLASAAACADVWLFDSPGQDWQHPHVVGSTQFDVFDPAEAVRRARVLNAERPIAGVWTPDEAAVISAAAIAESLGLPGPGSEAARAARDKVASRRAFESAGLLQPRSQPVTRLEDAQALAAAWGFPVVLKPRALGGSLGVIRVDAPEELAAAYDVARSAAYPGIPEEVEGVLVEEFLDGPEISIDGLFDGSRFHPIGVADKHLGPAPYFQEIGHDVRGVDQLGADLVDVAERAHRALGLGTLVTHTEIRTTSRGPAVIEVNARVGGDFIPDLIELATGVSPVRVAVLAALGSPEALGVPTRDRVACVRFCYPDRPGVLSGIVGVDALPSGVQLRQLAPAGTPLALPPTSFVGRYAALVATGDSLAECAMVSDTSRAVVEPIWA